MQQEPRDRDAAPSAADPPLDVRPHTLAAPMLRFDLRTEIDEVRKQDSYHTGHPTGRTLVKEPDLRIVLMALRAGARLEEHRASGPISIQALEGALRLRVGEGHTELMPGSLLMVEAGVPHDVEASEDAVFLLTIGRTTYRDVSDRHESHR